jgi:hypothetical protein
MSGVVVRGGAVAGSEVGNSFVSLLGSDNVSRHLV